jgi:hypothetical protein
LAFVHGPALLSKSGLTARSTGRAWRLSFDLALHTLLRRKWATTSDRAERFLAADYVHDLVVIPGVLGFLRGLDLHDVHVVNHHAVRAYIPPLENRSLIFVLFSSAMLKELAQTKASTAPAVALAWLLHHPAGIVPIIGSTNPHHIIEDCTADRVELSDEEWYELFAAWANIKSRSIQT